MTHTFHAGAFITEAGDSIPDVTVAYQTWGSPEARRRAASGENVVLVCHALTGDADAAAWWPGLVGPGRIIDPERHLVLCANALGSCYGTTGPGTLDASGRRLGSRFPRISVRDMARLHARLLDHLGIGRVALAAGGSMGGMQALELALETDAVDRLLLIGMGAEHAPWQIGISEAQRLSIRADRLWRGGDFAPEAPPEAGLAAARAMAMMLYRSPALYAERFGRRPQASGAASDGAAPFQVQSYLRYQGDKLAHRFDAGSYVALTHAMDSYDIARDRAPEALEALTAEALCVGISSDLLYPPEASCDLAARLPHGLYAELDSAFGHDAFLIDFEALDALVRPFLHDTGFLP
ncbi:homoserine O-acetyltransferase MetX [Rubricoccus marinus]|uniref:Homoserine O-acetyltransferase n=1 Tax=Rubricoccus marinus TaxID=716817 RepID=A0A259U0G0_9BACT|nr:homoserine O-acetyltransferase [Rubricoccus marinus]OZC03327.1 homoserine O-acetyltransferase [Rubricoccus marinus]